MLKKIVARIRAWALGLAMQVSAFMRAGIGPSEAVVTGIRKPLGYSQILNATLAASTGIVMPALPAGSVVGFAIIQCQAGTVRWRDDGTAPTAAVGMSIASGGELDYAGDFSALRFISSSGAPILDISLYG